MATTAMILGTLASLATLCDFANHVVRSWRKRKK